MKLDPQAPLLLSLWLYGLGSMFMGLECRLRGSEFLLDHVCMVLCLYGLKLMFMGVRCRCGGNEFQGSGLQRHLSSSTSILGDI